MSSYSSSELKVLQDNIPSDNFLTESFTLVNLSKNIVVEDAIRVDEQGNVIFKDVETELILKETATLRNNVIEKLDNNTDEKETIYFIDKNNAQISLGDLYENLFINKAFSANRWFSQHRSLNLDYSLEGKIKENFYQEVTQETINADGTITQQIDVIENGLSQSNVWSSLPIEIITDDYVSNKYGTISANIPLSYKTRKETTTVFRLYDATAGIELSRVSVNLPTSEVENIINIPLMYQGPLPDSPIAKDASECACITIEDFENLELVNGRDKGNNVTMDQDGHYLLPVSKHLIKIQWQTCNFMEDYIKDPSVERKVSINSDTSLTIDVYNNQQVDDDFLLLNGSFFIGDTNSSDNEYTVNIDTTKYNFGDDYNVSLSTTKNVQVSLIHKDNSQFIVKWNKNVSDCEVSWKITKVIKGVNEDLTELSNIDRELNYTLFKNKEGNVVDRNICDDLDTCTPNYGSYTFQEILPISGSATPISDDELVDGYKEYTLLGYISGGAPSQTLRFYKSKTLPKYDIYFDTQYEQYGSWNYAGNRNPGSNMLFTYSPSNGYCPQEAVNYKLPISTVRIPKVKCNLCEDVDITYTLVSTSGSKPEECGTQFYHVTDSFGNKGYSLSDNFQFQVGISTNDATCTFEISGGNNIVGTNETVTILKKVTYDEVAYGDTYALSGAPAPELGMFDPSETPSISGVSFDETVAFLTTDNKISLNVDYDTERYSKYFSPVDDRLLKTTAQTSISGDVLNHIVVTDEEFLGQENFGFQVLLFDPHLVSDPSPLDLPLYPSFDPIGNKNSLEEVREYIKSGNVFYTNENFIPFPNFKVGDVTIDGTKYNPLLDYRNYRVVGTYNTYFGTTTFTPSDLDTYKLSQNTAFELTNGNLYKVVNDGSNVGVVDYGSINGIDIKIQKSGRKFVPTTELFWSNFIDTIGNVTIF